MRPVVLGAAVVLVGLGMAAAYHHRPPIRTASVTGTVYPIPSSVVAGCGSTSTDQSAAINTWLASIPNGTVGNPSIAQFGASACYHVDQTIEAINHSNIVYEGNGATFQRLIQIPSTTGGYLFWDLTDGSADPTPDTNVTLQDIHVIGLNTTSDVTTGYQPSQYGSGCTVGSDNYCFESAYSFEEINGLTVDNVTSDATYGDGLTIGSEHPDSLVANATFTNVTVDRNGRQGVTVGDSFNLLFNNVKLLHSHASGFDMEINADGTIESIEIENSYINSDHVAVTAGGIADVSDVYIHNNEIKDTLASWPWLEEGNNPGNVGTSHNWRVVDNTSDTPLDSDTMDFQRTLNVSVLGNTSPANGSTNPYVAQLFGVSFEDDQGALTVAGNTFAGARVGDYTADSATGPVADYGNTAG